MPFQIYNLGTSRNRVFFHLSTPARRIIRIPRRIIRNTVDPELKIRSFENASAHQISGHFEQQDTMLLQVLCLLFGSTVKNGDYRSFCRKKVFPRRHFTIGEPRRASRGSFFRTRMLALSVGLRAMSLRRYFQMQRYHGRCLKYDPSRLPFNGRDDAHRGER